MTSSTSDKQLLPDGFVECESDRGPATSLDQRGGVTLWRLGASVCGDELMAGIRLPEADTSGRIALEQVIVRRRTLREFDAKRLAPEVIAQLCWAGQGITEPAEGLRASPSAGATYPIELYVASDMGVAQYTPARHELRVHLSGDVRRELRVAALDQGMLTQSPATFAIAANVGRTSQRYGERADRYCYIEAGHVAQNMLLQAEALGMGGVPIGAFEDRRVDAIFKLPAGQRVMYMLCIGYPRV